VEYSYGVPKRIDAVVIGAQHNEATSNEVIHRDIQELVRIFDEGQPFPKTTSYYLERAKKALLSANELPLHESKEPETVS
jgi:S-adenosylmethionine synthetase